MPQSSVLEPHLFLILYTDGLANLVLGGSKLVMYADDLLLYKTLRSPMDLLSLQHDIDSITSWIIDHDLTL